MEDQIVEQITLNKIVEQLLDLVTQARSLIESYQLKEKSLGDRESSVIDSEKILASKQEEFNTREAAVSHIEDVIELKKSSDKLIEENQIKAQALAKDREDFENYKQGETSRLNELRITTKKESDNLVIQRSNMEEEINRQVSEFIEKFKQSKA